MSFESIIEEIKAGLTGEREQDLPYLKEHMDRYKDHELAREILRECGRIMYELLPDETKAKVDEAMEKDFDWEDKLEKVGFYLYRKEFQKALETIEPLAEKLDRLSEGGMFENDSVNEYYCFDELFQEVLQRELSGSEKAFRRASLPFAKVYTWYGIVLMDLRRYEDAGRVLEKAIRWNPTDSNILFEYAESFKARGDIEQFFKLSKDAFQVAFRPASVARCFRNMGYYFTEMKQWDLAVACIVLSMQYVQGDKNAQSELYYIEHAAGRKINMPEFDEFRAYADQYGFPTGASETVLHIAANAGAYFLNEGNNDMAKYFLTIYYDLTEDEQVKEILEKLQENGKEGE